jgi:plastocyanin
MTNGSRLRAISGVMVALAAGLAVAGTASAAPGRTVVIEAQDACDESFGPLCNRADGDSGPRVGFEELLGRLQEDRAHGAWRFQPEKVKVRAGDRIVAKMGRGGEFHTFTEVAPAFGLGCVPELNHLVFGTDAIAEVCKDEIAPGVPRLFATTGVGPGVSYDAGTLAKGRHLFECMIHPWMKATVTVE